MRKIIINGRIVNNAEKKTNKNGREYIQFRFANNEYGDPKDENGKTITYWFNVTSYETRCMALQKYLTKGRPINIIGSYSDNLYQNKNTGNCDIGRNILAETIEFEVGRPLDENGQVLSNTSSTTNSEEMLKTQTRMVSSEVAQAAKAANVTIPVVNNGSDDDDLPF